MSYTIDVYRGNLKATRNFVTFALYVTFFPQLVAGPIVRATELLPQMARDRIFGDANFRVGVNFFLMGLVKKALLSDWISLVSDDIFANTSLYGTQGNWVGSVAYYVQIYCDFSGYSDMAIGTALMLGFRLPKNFDMPYLSASPTEFWRRWHISLSSWLRDYLYISLGGNRGSKLFMYRNLFLTMLLAGLWHGAGWNFVLWGAIHGLALPVHRKVSTWFPVPSRDRTVAFWLRRVAGVLLLNLFLLFTWPLFRAEKLQDGLTMLQKMVVWDASNPYPVPIYFWLVLCAMAIGHIMGTLFFDRLIDEKKPFLPWPLQAAVYALVVATVLLFAPSNAQPFIYFQF
jgi:alginate O-acetyltransferase complex protein AlgI